MRCFSKALRRSTRISNNLYRSSSHYFEITKVKLTKVLSHHQYVGFKLLGPEASERRSELFLSHNERIAFAPGTLARSVHQVAGCWLANRTGHEYAVLDNIAEAAEYVADGTNPIPESTEGHHPVSATGWSNANRNNGCGAIYRSSHTAGNYSLGEGLEKKPKQHRPNERSCTGNRAV